MSVRKTDFLKEKPRTIFAEFDFSTYLPYAIFGAVAVGDWVVFDLFAIRSTGSERRLEKLSKKKSTVDLLDEQLSVSLA
ncbi:hypothetical protein OAF71_00660 [bacterium]|nr:hypothetical protein [bacterium]